MSLIRRTRLTAPATLPMGFGIVLLGMLVFALMASGLIAG